MKPAAFMYHAPREVGSALDLLQSLPNARVLAGGQSLVPMLNMRYIAPDHVIDINKVEGLAGIRLRAGATIEIGAVTRQADLLAAPEIAARLPLVAAALRHVGHVQTRSRGTIGGSLCHLDPAAELPLVTLVHDATLIVHSPQGERSVPARQWPVGFMASALADDELLVAIRFDTGAGGAKAFGFQEFARRHGDFAVAAAAVLIDVERDEVLKARIGLAGIATTPVRLPGLEQQLLGWPVAALAAGERTDAAVAATLDDLDMLSDSYYSAAYRRRLAGVLLRRSLADAAARARGEAVRDW